MDHGGCQHDRLAAECWLSSLHAVILLGENKNAPLSLQGLTMSPRLVSNLLSPKYGDERLVPLQWAKGILAISFNFYYFIGPLRVTLLIKAPMYEFRRSVDIQYAQLSLPAG